MAAAKKESEEPRIVPVRGLNMFQHSQGWIMPSFVRHGISSLIFLGAHSFSEIDPRSSTKWPLVLRVGLNFKYFECNVFRQEDCGS